MIVVTSETIAGKKVVRTLGLVRGNTVRARHIGKDIMAGLRNIVGGEVHEYAKLIAESREQTLDRMTAAEMDVVGAHERGEYDAGLALGDAWERMLLDLSLTPAELMARAIRDYIANCTRTLPMLVEANREASIHFFAGNLAGSLLAGVAVEKLSARAVGLGALANVLKSGDGTADAHQPVAQKDAQYLRIIL